MGPLLFVLALHPLILKLQGACRLHVHVWNMDNGAVIGDYRQIAKALSIIQEEGPLIGLELNVGATDVFLPTLGPRIS